MSPARQAAFRALRRVARGERAEDALAAEAPQDARDRALCWRLVCGTLQRRLELDHVIAALSSRPLEHLDAAVVEILRLAVFELRYSRAPARAVVHQAVDLTRIAEFPRARGFVNAALRQHQRAVIDVPERLAASHPAWLLARWERRYGAEAALRWAKSNNEPAPLSLAFRDPEGDARRALEAVGLDLRPATAAGQPVPGVWYVDAPTGQVAGLPGAGRDFWVQDPAAAAVADLLGAGPGWRVLDACAAPGGKTLRLASHGAAVFAVDRSADRLQPLRHALELSGLGADVVAHDWVLGPLLSKNTIPSFDGVLVDAPCTGLGTLRRHPEIRWRRRDTDPSRMSESQIAILAAAAHHVRPGGVLVYAVCSPEPEEGEGVIGRFLSSRDDFRIETTWTSAPPQGDEDAFWGARLRRARSGSETSPETP